MWVKTVTRLANIGNGQGISPSPTAGGKGRHTAGVGQSGLGNLAAIWASPTNRDTGARNQAAIFVLHGYFSGYRDIECALCGKRDIGGTQAV